MLPKRYLNSHNIFPTFGINVMVFWVPKLHSVHMVHLFPVLELWDFRGFFRFFLGALLDYWDN